MFKSFRKYIYKKYRSRYERMNYPQALTVSTHLTDDEKYRLHILAKASYKRGATNFLEVGSYLGCSSLIIASAVDNPAIVHCVDTWENETMPEGPRDTFQDFIKNTRFFSHIITPHRGKSTDIAFSFSLQLEFIFFDGDHSYSAIKQDTQNWLPKLVPGGIVVFHDIGWAEGVQQVVREDILPKAVNVGTLPNMFWGTMP